MTAVLLQMAKARKNTALQIRVALSNSAGEVASDSFDVPAGCDDPDEIVNLAAADIIQAWALSAGDTITICRVAAGADCEREKAGG